MPAFIIQGIGLLPTRLAVIGFEQCSIIIKAQLKQHHSSSSIKIRCIYCSIQYYYYISSNSSNVRVIFLLVELSMLLSTVYQILSVLEMR